MYEELQRVDPVTAARLPAGDTQRIQRALEVFRVSGKPMSEHHSVKPELAAHAPLISLEPQDRSWLHARIERRFRQMLADGLVREVRGLRMRKDLEADLPSMRCVGYRQVWEALDNGTLDTVAERGIAATRQLAKRQLTWLRGMPQRQVIACDETGAIERTLALARTLAA